MKNYNLTKSGKHSMFSVYCFLIILQMVHVCPMPGQTPYDVKRVESIFEITNKMAFATMQKEKLIQHDIKKSASQSSLGAFFQKYYELKTPQKLNGDTKEILTIDTLIIGIPPNDSLIITGTFSHSGPIWVLGNGILKINNANFTNTSGDLIALGNAKIEITNSTVSFPQNYFYERSMIFVQNSSMKITNSTLHFSGMQHGLSVAQNASVVLNNVTQPDWTTAGITGHGSIVINGTDQAGEFVLFDTCSISVKNTSNVLLWHGFQNGSNVNWSFGTSDTAYNYHFNNTQPGVNGVYIDVQADSCYDIMWGIMPHSGSNVTINNSKIRATGVLFDNYNDSLIVTGLVNNSNYTSFTSSLLDRTLIFNNSHVATWNLYVFNNEIINVNSCIVGEIGSFNQSKMIGSNFIADGSGGYLFASDSSTSTASYLTTYSYIRSEKYGLFSVSNSFSTQQALAIGHGLLIVSQTTLPVPPFANDEGCAWYNHILQPATAYIDSVVTINGWAFIDKTPSSLWMDFSSRELFYQAPGSTLWIPIIPANSNEVNNSILGSWNTYGLLSGNYFIKQTITDTWGNKVDAFFPVTLHEPLPLGIGSFTTGDEIKVYPSLVTNQVNILVEQGRGAIVIVRNELGQLVMKTEIAASGNQSLDVSSFPCGLYYVSVNTGQKVKQFKIVKQESE